MILNKYNRFSLYLLLAIFNYFLSCNSKSNRDNNIAKVDSVAVWINLSKKNNLELEERKIYLSKAYQYIIENEIDTIQNKNLSIVAYGAYKLKDSSFFKRINYESLELFRKLKDTLGIGKIHWNFGNFFAKGIKMDSAYYHYHKALLNFNSINNEYYSGKMLYNMAFIQGRVKNYTASEKFTYQAISKFKSLKKHLNLYRCYNLLGTIYDDLEESDKAIDYYNQSLELLKKLKNTRTYKEGSLNNIGLVYQKKQNYKKAIQYFEKALENDSLKIKNINLFARLVRANSHFF